MAIRSLSVTRFRGFKSLDITGFRRINIFVGRSATGKTALLEAIRLALGATPSVAWTISALRSVIQYLPANPSRDQFEAAWSSLFFDFTIDERIRLSVTNDAQSQASVEIFFDQEKALTLPIPSASVPVTSSIILPLAFERRAFDGAASTIYANLNAQGNLNFEQGAEFGNAVEFFSTSAWQTNPYQTANWFSQLSIKNEEQEIVDVVSSEFPEITGLSVEAPVGVAPLLHASLKHRKRKLPIPLVSSGLSKLIALLTAIKANRNGILLVDEIENGIYYGMFSHLWQAIHSFVSLTDTQIFVTTHSWECLKAAAPLIEQHSSDFALVQLYQDEGTTHASLVSGERAAAAIEGGIEVRG
jgi:predicted ATPase